MNIETYLEWVNAQWTEAEKKVKEYEALEGSRALEAFTFWSGCSSAFEDAYFKAVEVKKLFDQEVYEGRITIND